MLIGEKIKRLRKEKGWTQEQLGECVGVQKAAINKYETGVVSNLKQETISALSHALHVSPIELLSPDDPPDPSPEVQPKNDDVRLLIRGLNQLSPEELEQATNVMRAMFAQHAQFFNKEDDDAT